jgi:toxin ParE1/3/4
MKVVWSERAQQDVHEAFAFISHDKPGAALSVVERLTEAGNRLAMMPFKGRVGTAAGTREFVVPRLPYVLVYDVDDDTVVIHRCLHGARRR